MYLSNKTSAVEYLSICFDDTIGREICIRRLIKNSGKLFNRKVHRIFNQSMQGLETHLKKYIFKKNYDLLCLGIRPAWRWLLTSSVTWFGHFRKFLVTRFLSKVAQMHYEIFGQCQKATLSIFNYCSYFLATLWKNWATF